MDKDEAIASLREICNEKIRKINEGRGVDTPGFRDINDLLKACDRVFAALEHSACPSS